MSKQNENDEVDGDDLAPFDDLVRALQGPGSAEELVDEQRFLAAFRETQAPVAPVVSLPRRLATRLGAGGTALIVAAAVSGGGVAAALTNNLPDPVQEFAHSVLGAPAPEKPSPVVSPAPAVIEPIEEPEVADPDPEGDPTAPASQLSDPDEARPNKPDRTSPSPSPTSSTEPSRAPSPSAEPTEPGLEPTQPPSPPTTVPAPASLAMSAETHLVSYGGTITLLGRVTDLGGNPVVGRRVVLQVRGPAGWRPVIRLRSDSAGVVTATSAAVTGLNRYRWRVGPSLRSPVWRVRVQATVSSSYAIEGDQTTVTVATSGGRPGDLVNLYVVLKKRLTFVAGSQLSAEGEAEFSLPTPPRRRTVVVRLERTLDHPAAKTRLTLSPPA